MSNLAELHAELADAKMTHRILITKLDILANIKGNEKQIEKNKDISFLIELTIDNIDIIERNINLRERGFFAAMNE